MDIRYKKLGKNTIVVFIGNAGSRIISFLMLPFYTHYYIFNNSISRIHMLHSG